MENLDTVTWMGLMHILITRVRLYCLIYPCRTDGRLVACILRHWGFILLSTLCTSSSSFLVTPFILHCRCRKQIFFTGLQPHGSTRPLVSGSREIPKWACRVTLICYPSKAIVHGSVSHFLAANPGKDRSPMYLTPEIYGGPHTPPPDGYYTSHATSSQDGTSVMDDTSLVNYHARSLLLWSHWVMGFLPERLKVEIDATKFLGAFSYTDRSGEAESMRPWRMAPLNSVVSPYGDKHVDAQTSMLHTHANRMSKALPRAAEIPVDLGYLTSRGKRTRPMCELIKYLN